MKIESINRHAVVRHLLVSGLTMMVLIASIGAFAFAAPTKAKTKRRVIPVTINKGQNYTIAGVKTGTNPSTKVVKNPNALVMQNAPGRIELVGADSGTWKINVTLASGEKVTYRVTVKAITPPQGTLQPTTAPTPIP
jgi:hypothetical protein